MPFLSLALESIQSTNNNEEEEEDQQGKEEIDLVQELHLSVNAQLDEEAQDSKDSLIMIQMDPVQQMFDFKTQIL
jgi:hypothetical protein